MLSKCYARHAYMSSMQVDLLQRTVTSHRRQPVQKLAGMSQAITYASHRVCWQ